MLKQNFCLRKNINLNILFRFSSVSLGIFLFLTIFPPVIKEKLASAIIDDDEYALALTNSGDINLTINPTSKDTAIAKSVITANTTSPAGYKLYVSTDNEETSDIHLSGYEDYDDADKKIATTSGSMDTPTALSDTGSSWGFAIPGMNNFDPVYNTEDATVGTKFAAVPTKYNEQLIHEHTGIANDDRTEVYYAFKADNDLTAGNYITTILYTTLSEATSDDVTEIIVETEKDLIENYTGETAIMKTSIMSSRRLSGIEIEVNDIPAEEVTVINAMPLELSFEIPEGLAVGDYDTELTINSIAKSYTIPDSIHVFPVRPESMQDMTPAYCDYMKINDQIKLTDVRDNKTYWVGKLADGDCWMTQNLDLDLSTEVTLISDTTDLNSINSWTPTESTAAEKLSSSNTWAKWPDMNGTSNKSLDAGDYYYIPLNGSTRTGAGNTTNHPYIDGRGYGCRNIQKCTVAFNKTDNYEGHTHVGNYYTYTAAVASNNTSTLLVKEDAPDSICPKGWRLPSADKWDNLFTYYTPEDMVYAPIYATRNGSAGPSYGLTWAYVDVRYWTSTTSNENGAKSVYSYVDKSGISELNLQGSGTSIGMAARCVMRRESTPTITFKNTDETVIESHILPDNGFTIPTHTEKTYFDFLGWSEDKNSTDPEYQDGNTVNKSTTLYAIYKRQLLNMQDVSGWKSLISEEEQVQVLDTRDNKLYWISKLKDGEIWMTQNLDYDIIVGSNTIATTAGKDSIWSAKTATADELENITSNTSTWSYDADKNIEDSDLINCTNDDNSGELCHYKVGNYYTWNAATGGTGAAITTGQAGSSICPKGWRLPIGNGAITTTRSFNKLFNEYGITTTSATIENITATFNAPMYMIGSGYISDGESTIISSYADIIKNEEFLGNAPFWTSTPTGKASTAYSTWMNIDGTFESNHSITRSSALPIRCVAL